MSAPNKDRPSWNHLLFVACEHIAAGAWEDARDIFGHLLMRGNPSLPTLVGYGVCCLMTGQDNPGHAAITQAIEKAKQYPPESAERRLAKQLLTQVMGGLSPNDYRRRLLGPDGLGESPAKLQ